MPPPLLRIVSLVAAAVMLPVNAALSGDIPVSAAGHWEGQIKLPGTGLSIAVDMERKDGTWTGSIDIPAQGLHGCQLNGIKAQDFDVAFAMPGIPGEPTFAGKLKEVGKVIEGDFTQGGQTFPFLLKRTAASLPKPGETPSKGQPGSGLAGSWQGSLKPLPMVELRMSLEISKGPEGILKGFALSLDQGGPRMPLTAIKEDAGVVHLEVASVGGEFDGKMSTDGSEVIGEWQQSGSKLPLVYKRMSSPAKPPARPQEPKKPFPYMAEEVTVDNTAANIKLAGTFTFPKEGGPHPAVVLISGSGPQDRNEALMGHKPFLVLADHLTRAGIAVLRCDDRGVGRSKGSFATATDADFAEDVLACVSWLKARKEVDPKRIGLVGHSEGGVVAPLAVVRQPEDVAFLVMLAGVGLPPEELLIRQGADMARAEGLGEAAIAKASAMKSRALALIKEATNDQQAQAIVRQVYNTELAALSKEERTSLGMSSQAITAEVKGFSSRWFRELLTYDPHATLAQVKCPVLAINGEKDIQVAAKENLAGIRQALADGGNKDVTTLELPGLNHLFQTCTTGTIGEYSKIEETFSPAAMKVVSDWIRKKSGLQTTSPP